MRTERTARCVTLAPDGRRAAELRRSKVVATMQTTDTPRRRWRGSAGLLAALSVVGAALLLGLASPARADTTAYTDPSGGSGLAADIQTVSVSDYHGTVTFAITAPGLQVGGGVTESYVDTYVDADQNAATGDDGADYAFEVGVDASGTFWGMYRYVGGEWQLMTQSPDTSLSSSGDTYTFTFAATDFGATTAFDFWLFSGAEDSGALVGYDVAPDGAGWWSYTVTSTAPYVPQAGELAGLTTDGTVYVMGDDGMWHWVSAQVFAAEHYDWNAITWYGELYAPVGDPQPLPVTGAVVTPPVSTAAHELAAPLATSVALEAVIARPIAVPKAPVAGKPFTVSFAVTRSDIGGPLTLGTIVLTPTINGVVVKHGEQFQKGIASLSLTVPKTARGKTLKVSLSVKVEGSTTTRAATFHVA
jgi:hypothetical protein